MARNGDDEEEEEASTEEHRILGRMVGKSWFLAPRRPDTAFATDRLARSQAKPLKTDIIVSKRLLRCAPLMDFGLKLEVQKNRACTTLTGVFRQRLGRRQTHAQVRVFVGDHARWTLARRVCSSTVGDRSVMMRG